MLPSVSERWNAAAHATHGVGGCGNVRRPRAGRHRVLGTGVRTARFDKPTSSRLAHGGDACALLPDADTVRVGGRLLQDVAGHGRTVLLVS